MTATRSWIRRQRSSLGEAAEALRAWRAPQVISASVGAAAVGVVIGVATVLIPNPLFVREIAPTAWSYPVWIVTSILTGILIATYVRPVIPPAADDAPSDSDRSAKVGGAAGVLAWFAVGCPVCNKIALLAFGYTGALTWFAPLQPFLALVALLLSLLAVVWRLRGQVSCPTPDPEKVTQS